MIDEIYKLLLLIILTIYILSCIKSSDENLTEKEIIKIALCTIGKKENLYVEEFIEYYIKLGVDKMFIYDDNDPFTEKMEDVIDPKYKNKVSFMETKKLKLGHQSLALTHCYQSNYKNFDWFIMVDMDEFLYIINNTLKNYLSNNVFDKCDFIKIHWMNSRDNNLLYYDPRPLFVRFKEPYIKLNGIKSIIRGNITNLKYWVHSPKISPEKNITCDNEGNILTYQKLNFETIDKININKAYLIHFKYKSTEEFINKYKRGYSNWYGNKTSQAMQAIK